ncbi:MAG TPA: amidohydrolase family protein [Actinomycetota bacterium]|nr:amidohydrolase family protein [Actinomycetota bacterium]
MRDRYDLVVTNARLRSEPEPGWSIGIKDGSIQGIDKGLLSGHLEIDAEGNLVTESFVDPHLHLCKVYTITMLGDAALRAYTGGSMGAAMTAIELASAVKDHYEEDWIYHNARRALLEGLGHGVTHAQAFADTDTRARLEGVRALLRVRDELKDVMAVQVVAFPQDGVVRDAGASDYVREALELGADVVGGIPWIEFTDADAAAHIDAMLDLAAEFQRPAAMLVDDAGDPGLRTTEMLASAALERELIDRVVACHARAMNLYPEPYFRRLVGLVTRARMTFVTDPHTGALCTRALDLLNAGIPVALGQDDIADAYYPYGRHNPLEVAFIASHVLGASSFDDMETLYDMVTRQAARVLRISNHGVEVGYPANLVVLDGGSVWEALTRHGAPRYVISRGRIVAESKSITQLHGIGDE